MKKLLTVISLALCSSSALAQVSFTNPTNIPLRPTSMTANLGVYGITATDLKNNDGAKEIIVTNSYTGTFSVLEGGNGTNWAKGSFQTLQQTAATDPYFASAGQAPRSTIAIDLDGGNNHDLVSINNNGGSNPDNAVVFLGNGTGQIPAKVEYPLGTATEFVDAPRLVTSGYFNSDSYVDIAVANVNTHNVSILFGNGTGGLSAPTVVELPAGSLGSICIATGRFNNDDKDDLAVCNRDSNDISILIQDSSDPKGFTALANIPVGTQPRSMVAVDTDNDANKLTNFIAVANNGEAATPFAGKGISVLYKATSGLFEVDQGAGLDPNITIDAGNVGDIVAGQYSSDGTDKIIDLAAASAPNGTVSIYEGKTNGKFETTPAATYSTGLGSQPFCLWSGDLNMDGQDDLTSGNFGTNDVSVFISNRVPTKVSSFVKIDKNLVVYPNPVEDGRFTVEIQDTSISKNARIHLVDVTGKIVKKIESGIQELNHVDVSGLHLKSGNYFVKVIDGKKVGSKQITIR